jgi:hypothetical protein
MTPFTSSLRRLHAPETSAREDGALRLLLFLIRGVHDTCGCNDDGDGNDEAKNVRRFMAPR